MDQLIAIVIVVAVIGVAGAVMHRRRAQTATRLSAQFPGAWVGPMITGRLVNVVVVITDDQLLTFSSSGQPLDSIDLDDVARATIGATVGMRTGLIVRLVDGTVISMRHTHNLGLTSNRRDIASALQRLQDNGVAVDASTRNAA